MCGGRPKQQCLTPPPFSSHRHDDEEIDDTTDHIKAGVMQPKEMQVAATQFQGVLGAGVARLSGGEEGPEGK